MAALKYRLAKNSDCNSIALLHARSWQEHYRGLCPDSYLDHEVELERLGVWKDRFALDNPKRHILVVENDKNELVGFVCTFLDEHIKFGAYLDNLHVRTDYQGHGIGKKLMKAAAIWVKDHRPASKIYLHVLKENYNAIKFYEKIGGENIGESKVTLPWNSIDSIVDYAWELDDLI